MFLGFVANIWQLFNDNVFILRYEFPHIWVMRASLCTVCSPLGSLCGLILTEEAIISDCAQMRDSIK